MRQTLSLRERLSDPRQLYPTSKGMDHYYIYNITIWTTQSSPVELVTD